MHPEQKGEWLEYLYDKIKTQNRSIGLAEYARDTSDSKMQSRYDTQREDHNLEVNIGLDTLKQLSSARKEIAGSDLRYKVEPGAYVDALIDGVPTRLLYLTTRVELPDVEVVTPQSPIGQAIKDKIAGDQATYKVRERVVKVAIRSIL